MAFKKTELRRFWDEKRTLQPWLDKCTTQRPTLHNDDINDLPQFNSTKLMDKVSVDEQRADSAGHIA